jgi:hypothetical protein
MMSRVIDLSDPSSLSEEDIKYLQDRGRRPAGIPPVGVGQPGVGYPVESVPLEEVPHTGDVGANPPNPHKGLVSYHGATVSQLQDEIRYRNQQNPEAPPLSIRGNKAELIAELEADDDDNTVLDDDEDGDDSGNQE